MNPLQRDLFAGFRGKSFFANTVRKEALHRAEKPFRLIARIGFCLTVGQFVVVDIQLRHALTSIPGRWWAGSVSSSAGRKPVEQACPWRAGKAPARRKTRLLRQLHIHDLGFPHQ